TMVCGGVPIANLSRGPGAICATSALAVGAHQIVAVYSGDTRNAASTSNPLWQSIVGSAVTTTTLTSSLNPSRLRNAVTFLAEIIGQAPTGTIKFLDGGKDIAGCASIAMAASKARCSTTALKRGKHSI